MPVSNSTLDDRLERWISLAQKPQLWKAMTKRDWASLEAVLLDVRLHGRADIEITEATIAAGVRFLENFGCGAGEFAYPSFVSEFLTAVSRSQESP